jgi:hypothetical protein
VAPGYTRVYPSHAVTMWLPAPIIHPIARRESASSVDVFFVVGRSGQSFAQASLVPAFRAAWRRRQCQCGRRLFKRILLVLFGKQNRTFCPYLAAINRNFISVMWRREGFNVVQHQGADPMACWTDCQSVSQSVCLAARLCVPLSVYHIANVGVRHPGALVCLSHCQRWHPGASASVATAIHPARASVCPSPCSMQAVVSICCHLHVAPAHVSIAWGFLHNPKHFF